MALRHVGLWHFSDIPACPLNGRYQGESGVRRETGKE